MSASCGARLSMGALLVIGFWSGLALARGSRGRPLRDSRDGPLVLLCRAWVDLSGCSSGSFSSSAGEPDLTFTHDEGLAWCPTSLQEPYLGPLSFCECFASSPHGFPPVIVLIVLVMPGRLAPRLLGLLIPFTTQSRSRLRFSSWSKSTMSIGCCCCWSSPCQRCSLLRCPFSAWTVEAFASFLVIWHASAGGLYEQYVQEPSADTY